MDWKRLLDELNDAGWHQGRVAEACGVGQSTISDLYTGRTKEPRFALGSALQRLHSDVTGELSKAA